MALADSLNRRFVDTDQKKRLCHRGFSPIGRNAAKAGVMRIAIIPSN
ncbi:hypothetical protein [Escherichia coli]|nr:hypothetical protein [Escherichia coli]